MSSLLEPTIEQIVFLQQQIDTIGVDAVAVHTQPDAVEALEVAAIERRAYIIGSNVVEKECFRNVRNPIIDGNGNKQGSLFTGRNTAVHRATRLIGVHVDNAQVMGDALYVGGTISGGTAYTTIPIGVRPPYKVMVGTVAMEIPQMNSIVKIDGNEVALTNIEYELLKALVKNAGTTQLRTNLLEVIGHPITSDPHIIDVHIGNMRKKLKQNGGLVGLITTERGKGFFVRPDHVAHVRDDTLIG